MPNYFDQFDEPSSGGNFFDQFDKIKRGVTDWAKVPATAINAVPAQIAGLPVDTALNVANLARAGYGYATGKNTELLNPQDYFGSSENLLQKMRGMGVQVDNPLPENPVARTLWSGFNTAGNAAAFGGGAGKLGGFTSGALAQIMGEQTGRPEPAILASMIPGVSRQAVNLAQTPSAPKTEGIKQAVDYAQRENIPVTRGQQTGGTVTGLAEKLLAAIPGSSGYYAKVAQEQQARVDSIANRLTQGGAGALIQNYGKDKTVTLDPQFFDEMAAIKDKFGRVAAVDSPTSAVKAINSYIGETKPNPLLGQVSDRFISAGGKEAATNYRDKLIKAGVPEEIPVRPPMFKVNEQIPMVGEAGDFNNYWALRSLYSGRSTTGDPVDKSANRAIAKAFDAAAERSLARAGVDQKKLEELRQTYGVERVITKAIRQLPDGTEIVDAKKLGAEIASRDAKNQKWADWMGAQGEQLRSLGNFGTNIRPVPTSGVVENRLAAKMAATLGIGGLGAGLGGMAFSMPWLAGAGGTALGLTALPYAVNKLMQSGRGPHLFSSQAELAKIGSLNEISQEEQRKRLLDMGLVGPTY